MSRLEISILRRVACVSVLACLFCAPLCAQQVEAKGDAKELEVLAKFIGTWDTKVETGNGQRGETEVVADWMLDGKFVRRSIKLSNEKIEMHEVMTFDKFEKCFRRWEFRSGDGSPCIEYRGTWDDESQTMTWIASLKDGVTRTTKCTFEDELTQRLEDKIQNSKGKQLGATRALSTKGKKTK
jgi:hypothetical protein